MQKASIILLCLLACCSDDDTVKPVINVGQGVTDIDGNFYETIIIGDQEWMASNLKTTKLNDGTELASPDLNSWFELSKPGYCFYDNKPEYKNSFGALYNWYAIDSKKLCPPGWHIPSAEEWDKLIKTLGGTSVAGGKLKNDTDLFWRTPNKRASNESMFNGLPAGYNYENPKAFGNMWVNGFFWSSSIDSKNEKPFVYVLSYDKASVSKVSDYSKKQGLSIRCIKD